MKVIKRAVMPNGIKIQLEDWKEDYEHVNIVNIAAYPIAKNTGKYKWIEAGSPFRLGIDRNFKSDDEVIEIFKGLIDGTIKLEDLSDHFYNRNKDKWYLGMNVEYMGW